MGLTVGCDYHISRWVCWWQENPLLPTQPCHLARPQPTVPRYLLRCNPDSGCTLIIPHWVTSSGATVPLTPASATDREESTRHSSTWLRFSAHVECFDAGLCFQGSVADYIPIWPPWQESCLAGLADTASQGRWRETEIKIWCSAAAPIRRRL